MTQLQAESFSTKRQHNDGYLAVAVVSDACAAVQLDVQAGDQR